jgi:hypothetical protein
MKELPIAIDNRIDDQDRPFNASLAERKVDDPRNAGRFVIATASLRDDPLGQMHARRQIEQYQFAAGRHMQAAFECAELGALQAVDPGKPVIDSGQTNFSLTERQCWGFSVMRKARDCLGKRDYDLCRDILMSGMFIEEVAAKYGKSSRLGLKILGSRFRSALDDLADLLGYRGKGPDKLKRA